MARQPTPIKRSEQLAPLSREHHEGLLFVWKIRQGIKYGIEENRLTGFCRWFWHQHLADHFQKEEEMLPPVLSPDHPLIRQLFTEHKAIKEQFEQMNEATDYKALDRLAQNVNDHIRFEERQLFNEVERAAFADQLQHIARQLNEKEKKAVVWEDEFWIK